MIAPARLFAFPSLHVGATFVSLACMAGCPGSPSVRGDESTTGDEQSSTGDDSSATADVAETDPRCEFFDFADQPRFELRTTGLPGERLGETEGVRYFRASCDERTRVRNDADSVIALTLHCVAEDASEHEVELEARGSDLVSAFGREVELRSVTLELEWFPELQAAVHQFIHLRNARGETLLFSGHRSLRSAGVGEWGSYDGQVPDGPRHPSFVETYRGLELRQIDRVCPEPHGAEPARWRWHVGMSAAGLVGTEPFLGEQDGQWVSWAPQDLEQPFMAFIGANWATTEGCPDCPANDFRFLLVHEVLTSTGDSRIGDGDDRRRCREGDFVCEGWECSAGSPGVESGSCHAMCPLTDVGGRSSACTERERPFCSLHGLSLGGDWNCNFGVAICTGEAFCACETVPGLDVFCTLNDSAPRGVKAVGTIARDR